MIQKTHMEGLTYLMMKFSHDPVLSIIIVNYNCCDGLKKTLSFLESSLISYAESNLIEVVVIDGFSNDDSLAVANSFSCFIDKFICEVDGGIYDAMNKGIYISSGKYCYFLNTNDIFDFDVLVRLMPMLKKSEKKLLTFNVNVFDKDNNYVKILKPENIKIDDFKKTMPVCHQGVIFKRTHELFYNSSYRIIGDKDLVYRYLKLFNDDVEYFDINLMEYKRDGFSVNNIITWKYENILFAINNFGFGFVFVRSCLSYIKAFLMRKK